MYLAHFSLVTVLNTPVKFIIIFEVIEYIHASCTIVLKCKKKR